jgi:alpha-ribazole phosphatase
MSIDFCIALWESTLPRKNKVEIGCQDMNGIVSGELLLIRHAPVSRAGVLFGRTDVDARIDRTATDALRAGLGPFTRVVSSPARRCRQTAEALFDSHTQDARLWEQDFGAHDGMPFADLPDIGILSGQDLARHAAPGGESFFDLCARTAPALSEYGRMACDSGPVALVVHAGVIRAALALVTGTVPGGLVFEVANLSVTRLRCGPQGPLSVVEVNRT